MISAAVGELAGPVETGRCGPCADSPRKSVVFQTCHPKRVWFPIRNYMLASECAGGHAVPFGPDASGTSVRGGRALRPSGRSGSAAHNDSGRNRADRSGRRGPGGLYLESWVKQFDPAGEVVVWQCNRVGDTFGFGVVFSDGTLLGIKDTDPALYDAMAARSERWADIAVRYRGEAVRSVGHGFAAIGRKELLRLLYRRCAEAGVTLRFGEQGPPVERLLAEYDLVVAADGANSAIRSGRSDAFGTSLDTRSSRYIWLAVDRPFDALTFLVAESGHGALHGHTYPFSAELSTFIVEADEHAWRAAGLAGPIMRRDSRRERPVRRRAAGGDLRRHPGRAPAHRKPVPVAEIHGGPQPPLAPGRSGAARGRRPHDALLHRIGHQARHGGRPGAGGPAPGPRLSRGRRRFAAGRARRVRAAPRARRGGGAAGRAGGLEWFEGIGLAMGREASQFAFELLTRGGRLSCEDLTAAVRSSDSSFR